MNSTEFICGNIGADGAGELTFAGQNVPDLAKTYGTPLYLMDADLIRSRCRTFVQAFKSCFPAGSRPFYASKACAFREMYRIVAAEGMAFDAVSPGEIATAAAAGVNMADVAFHGNNKTDADIRFGLKMGVGCFVVDGSDELGALQRICETENCRAKVLLRITPGIDPHTYAAVDTGRVDCKFGTAIETGQALAFVSEALRLNRLELLGLHCHVGSMVFGEDIFQRTLSAMLAFIKAVKAKTGFLPAVLDIGGGFGVRYVAADPTYSLTDKLAEIGGYLQVECGRLELPAPALWMEPGRSIVADAGMTVYTVGSVKRIPGYRNYVSVDGGMTDNPRFALYGSRYTCYAAERPLWQGETMQAALVGRCCESGDIIDPEVTFPADIARGETVAVCTTGAYNYSMASNYNRIPRPPVILLGKGKSKIAVERETLEDLMHLDR